MRNYTYQIQPYEGVSFKHYKGEDPKKWCTIVRSDGFRILASDKKQVETESFQAMAKAIGLKVAPDDYNWTLPFQVENDFWMSGKSSLLLSEVIDMPVATYCTYRDGLRKMSKPYPLDDYPLPEYAFDELRG